MLMYNCGHQQENQKKPHRKDSKTGKKKKKKSFYLTTLASRTAKQFVHFHLCPAPEGAV